MPEKITNFRQLKVWEKSHNLVLDTYKVTMHYSREEKYGLVSQMRRSAVSVPTNIAEGFKRRGKADKAHFYNVAQSSLEELYYYFLLSADLGYTKDSAGLRERAEEVGRMLIGLIEAVKKRPFLLACSPTCLL